MAAAALVPGSASFGRQGDLRRRAASAGHGGVEPGRGSASAPRDPPGEHGRGPGCSPLDGSCAGTTGPAAAAAGELVHRGRRAGPRACPSFLSFTHWLVRSFSGPNYGHCEKCQARRVLGKLPNGVGVEAEGNRYINSHNTAGTGKAMLIY